MFEARPLPNAWHRALPRAKSIDLLLACKEGGVAGSRTCEQGSLNFGCTLIMTPPNAGEMDCKVTQGGGQWEGKKQLSLAVTGRLYGDRHIS